MKQAKEINSKKRREGGKKEGGNEGRSLHVCLFGFFAFEFTHLPEGGLLLLRHSKVLQGS